MPIADALAAYGSRQREWEHDRSKTVGASDVPRCIRATWFRKRGIVPDPGHVESWGYRQRGSVFEDHFFVPAMRAHYGDRFLFGGGEQRTFMDPASPLSATPDGVLVDVTMEEADGWGLISDCVVVECKSIGSFRIESLPKIEHVFQVQVQLGLVRAAGIEYVFPGAGVLAYVSAFDWSRVAEFPVRFDPDILEAARARARTIMTADSTQLLEPEGLMTGECRFCPWAHACRQIEVQRRGGAVRAA